MKKLLLIFMAVMLSFAGYSQAILEEGFEGDDFPPAGWSADGNWDYDDYYVKSGAYAASSSWSSSPLNSYLITPQLELDGNYILSFWVYSAYPSFNYNTTFTVEVSTSGTSVSDFEVLQTIDLPSSNDWSFVEISLQQYNGENVYIAFHVNDNDGTSVNIDDIAISPAPTCLPPTGITASNVDMTSATISWTEFDAAQTYTVQYKNGGSWDNANVVVTSDNFTDLTDLISSSSYSVRIQSDCGEEYPSEWSTVYNFVTSCGGIDVSETPWFEDFESTPGNGEVNFSACWGVPLKPNGPFIYCGHAESCHSGFNSAELKGAPAYLILPEFEQDITDLRLTFWATATSTTTGNVKVGVVTDPNNYNTFIELSDAGTPAQRGNSEGVDGNGSLMGPFDFSTLETEEDLSDARIALYYTSTSQYNSWNLDDFTVSLIPECAEPSQLVTGNVSATSVTLSWAEVEDATYDLVYYPTSNSDDQTIVEGVSLTDGSYLLEDLNPSTKYSWTLRTDCGDGTYANAYSTLTFTTPGLPIELPYERTFEEDPSEITEFNFQASGVNQWAIGTATFLAEDGETSGHSLYISNDDGVSNSYTISNSSYTNDYAYAFFNVEFDDTPMEYHLTFDYKTMGEGSSYNIYDFLSVYLVDGGVEVPTSGDPNGTALLSKQYNVADWTHVDFILENVVGTSKKVVFYWKNDHSTGTQPPAAIDNIRLVGNECGQPSNLAVSGVTTTSATLSWTENGLSTEWTLYWKEQGSEDEYATETASDEPTVDLSSLEPNTAYTCYVVSNCESGDSEPSQMFTFRTSCDPISVAEEPWTSDFEGTDEEYLNCWASAKTAHYTNSLGTFDFPHITQSTNISHTGSSALEIAFGEIVTALPAFEENISELQLTMWVRGASSFPLYVGYITDAYDKDTFVALDTLTMTSYTRYEKSFVALADEDLPEGTRIAFRINPGSSTSSWYVDDMQVGLIPTCSAPIYNSVAISNVTATSAQVSFTDEDATHDAWMIYYSPAGSEDDYETVDAFSTEGNLIENLEPNTTYTVYVKTVCDGEAGENQTDAKTFTTTTIPAEIPMDVDFEDEEENASWVLLNGTQTNKWYIGTDTVTTVNNTEDGEIALYVSNDDGATNAYSNTASRVYAYRDILVPDGVTELQLSFDWKANGRTSAEEFLRVYWFDPSIVTLTAGNNPPSVGGVNYDSKGQIGNYGPNATEHWLAGETEWQHIEMNINSDQFAGMGDGDKVYRLVFHWRNYYSYYNSPANPPASVDNITLKAVECLAPVNVTVSDITETTANVSWEGDAEEYSVIVTQGTNVTYSTTTNTEINLDDLISSSTATVTVRALCGNDSSFSVTKTFNTSCGAITITEDNPFFEDFESYPGANEALALSVCWPTPLTFNANNGLSPFVYVGYAQSCYSGFNSVEFKGGSMFVLPEFTNDLADLRISFWATKTSGYSSTVSVGYITDVTDPETFVAVVADMGTPANRGDQNGVSGNGSYMGPFDFIGIDIPEGARIALRNNDPTTSNSPQSCNIDDITVELIPDCPSPVKNSVTFANITAHTATVSWTDNDEEHSAWKVYYKAANSEDEWETVDADSGEPTVEITGLAAETQYQVYVITICDEEVDYPDATVTKTFTTAIACPAPTGLQASAISTESATISWTGNADSYIVAWGTESEIVDGNSYEITGLSASTSYTVSVTADCGEEDGTSTASTVSFMTACDIITDFTYTESFEAGLGCWTSEVVNNPSWGSAEWTTSSSYQTNGAYSVYFPYYTGASARLVSPIFDLTSLDQPYLSYDLYMRPYSGTYDKLDVYYRVDNSSEWISLASYTDNGGNSSFGNYTLALPNATETYQVMFLGEGLDAYGIYLDNIRVFDSIGGVTPEVCNVPTNVTVEAAETTADVSWTAGGDETAWKLQYKLASASTWGNEIDVNNNPTYQITGLTAGTNYQVRVKAVCTATSSSDWTSATNFATTGGGVVVTEPTVVTNDATNINQTSATLKGEITDLGNQTITARGFEWKAVQGGTVAIASATGTILTADLTDLSASTEYTFRAFATTANTTTYGEWKNFTTLAEVVEPCNAPTNVTVSDFDNSSITITWDANGASAWNVQYRVQGATTWTLGGGNITTPTYTITGLETATIYQIQVQAVCDGTTSDWSEMLEQTTGINDLLKQSISLCPNPANDYVDVRVSDNDVKVSRLEVYDVYGKLLNEVEVLNNPTRINVSSLANGMYYVRVITESGVATKNFIKK